MFLTIIQKPTDKRYPMTCKTLMFADVKSIGFSDGTFFINHLDNGILTEVQIKADTVSNFFVS